MSGKIRFISDPHFGHKNMATMRGFNSAHEHDEHIIDCWNKVVDKRDTTWILGDITMEKGEYEILDRLNGFKRVVLGNHDPGNHIGKMLKYVNTIHGMSKFRHKKYGSIWLTHCPISARELNERVNYNIHGHIHDSYVIADERFVNVCMEVQDFTPKTIEELLK